MLYYLSVPTYSVTQSVIIAMTQQIVNESSKET